MSTIIAKIIAKAGTIPAVGASLRRLATRYPEGSVVKIKTGHARGLKWKRHHRYVNGYWLGIYELPLQEALARELAPGKTFFDVGANAGFFSMIGAGIVGRAGTCVAFEPLPENAQSVREQIALNGFTHCHVVEEAVSDKCGQAEFVADASGSPTAHLGKSDKPGKFTHRISTTTLSDAAIKWGQPHLIKLDIEGAEVLALEGARALSQTSHPTWIIEVHGQWQDDETRRILAQAGYSFFDLQGRESHPSSRFPYHLIAK